MDPTRSLVRLMAEHCARITVMMGGGDEQAQADQFEAEAREQLLAHGCWPDGTLVGPKNPEVGQDSDI